MSQPQHGPDPSDSHARHSIEPQATRSTFALWRSPLAVAPLLFLGTFVMRSVFPMFDSIVFSITVALTVVTAAMFVGQRWAGGAFLLFPVALFTSPAGREFAFNLSAIDNRVWRWHSIVGLVAMGISCVVAVYVMLGRKPGGLHLAGSLVGGSALGAIMIAALASIHSHPGFGQTLSAQTIASLPAIDLLNYAYDIPDISVTGTESLTLRVDNPSNLPHSVTIDSLDINVFVPAGRSSVLEISAKQLQQTRGQLPIYCIVGDHKALGMARTLGFTVE
jgi:hypothetical protein